MKFLQKKGTVSFKVELILGEEGEKFYRKGVPDPSILKDLGVETLKQKLTLRGRYLDPFVGIRSRRNEEKS